MQTPLIQRGLRPASGRINKSIFCISKIHLVSMARRVNGEGFLGMTFACIALACFAPTNFLGLCISTLSVPKAEF